MRWGLLCFKSIQWCYRLICCFLGPKIAYLGTEVFVEILYVPRDLLGFLPWAGKIIERHYRERMSWPVLFGIIAYNAESHAYLHSGGRESLLLGRKAEAWYRAAEKVVRKAGKDDPVARQAYQEAEKELDEYEDSLEAKGRDGNLNSEISKKGT